MFIKTMQAGWSDMDFNSHMRNTAFLDKAADARMMFFAEHDFPMQEFMRLRIGPVVRKDEIEYFREVHLLNAITVTLCVAGLAEDGSRFMLRNEFWLGEETLAARVTSTGGWLNLQERKLQAPPQKLLQAVQQLTRTEDFQVLTSSLKK